MVALQVGVPQKGTGALERDEQAGLSRPVKHADRTRGRAPRGLDSCGGSGLLGDLQRDDPGAVA